MSFSGRPQVMIVDDDLAMCSYLRTFLGSRGYEAVALTNAEDAIRRFQIERPMAVLLDVVLPGMMDGLAALAFLDDDGFHLSFASLLSAFAA